MMFAGGITTGLKGLVKQWQVINKDGTVEQQGGGFENLIVDQGMDMPSNNVFAALTRYCSVGTGTASPSQSDTGLVNEIARTGNIAGIGNTGTYNQDGNLIDSDRQPGTTLLEHRRTFLFSQGTLDSSVDGDYGELGFSPQSTSGANLFSRTLFRDNNGNAVTVTVSSDQALQVTYSLIVRPKPDTQTSSSANITNVGTINYDHMMQRFNGISGAGVTIPFTNVDTTDGRTRRPGGGVVGYLILEPSVDGSNSSTVAGAKIASGAYTFASIGVANSQPSGNTSIDSITKQSYTSGNYYIDKDYFMSTSTFADSTVTTFYFSDEGNNVIYALVIDSADRFTKSSTNELTLTFRQSWTRA